MKLALCILAFERGIAISTRPEDRSLAAQYLAALATVLAAKVAKEEVGSRIEAVDRLIGQTWIVDVAPFEQAFTLWSQAKLELRELGAA